MTLQYGELRPTSSWDRFVSLGHPSKFQRVSRLGSVTARHSSSGRQPNFAVWNRRRHLYLPGWPSCWASAHILVVIVTNFISLYCKQKKFRLCGLYVHAKSSCSSYGEVNCFLCFSHAGVVSVAGTWSSSWQSRSDCTAPVVTRHWTCPRTATFVCTKNCAVHLTTTNCSTARQVLVARYRAA